MASTTVNVRGLFVDGTVLTLYPSKGRDAYDGTSHSIGTDTVTDGAVVFDALEDHQSYFVVGIANGVERALKFMAGEIVPPPHGRLARESDLTGLDPTAFDQFLADFQEHLIDETAVHGIPDTQFLGPSFDPCAPAWGAAGDGSDDTTALQLCLAAAAGSRARVDGQGRRYGINPRVKLTFADYYRIVNAELVLLPDPSTGRYPWAETDSALIVNEDRDAGNQGIYIDVSIDGGGMKNWLTTADITNGSDVLTPAELPDADFVGAPVVVEGAGAAGADLVTTIESIGASTVTLADPASTTVNDGVTFMDQSEALVTTAVALKGAACEGAVVKLDIRDFPGGGYHFQDYGTSYTVLRSRNCQRGPFVPKGATSGIAYLDIVQPPGGDDGFNISCSDTDGGDGWTLIGRVWQDEHLASGGNECAKITGTKNVTLALGLRGGETASLQIQDGGAGDSIAPENIGGFVVIHESGNGVSGAEGNGINVSSSAAKNVDLYVKTADTNGPGILLEVTGGGTLDGMNFRGSITDAGTVDTTKGGVRQRDVDGGGTINATLDLDIVRPRGGYVQSQGGPEGSLNLTLRGVDPNYAGNGSEDAVKIDGQDVTLLGYSSRRTQVNKARHAINLASGNLVSTAFGIDIDPADFSGDAITGSPDSPYVISDLDLNEHEVVNAADPTTAQSLVTRAYGEAHFVGSGGPPSGAAGGVLGGTYPNPSFGADMATQAELDAVSAAKQPLDSDLTAIAALSTTSFGRAFLALADAAAGRTALGLGTAATHATGDYDAAGAAAAAQAASQPLDSDLTAVAALSTAAYGRGLLEAASATAARTLLGVDASSAGMTLGGTASTVVSEVLSTPQVASHNGFTVKGITGWDGTQAYGTAQAFMLLRDDNSGGDNLYGSTATAPDRDVLVRVDGRTGAFGTSGGAHFAAGLRQHTDFTATQNVWIQNYLDTIGLVISTASGGTADFYRFQSSAGTVKARMDSGGNLSLGSASPVAKLCFPAATLAAGGVDFGGGEIQIYRSAANALQFDNTTLGFKVNSATLLQAAQTASVGVLSNRLISTDTQASFRLDGDGSLTWGPGGSTARDLMLKRSSAGVLAVRNLADSADANLTVGALTTSAASSLAATTLTGALTFNSGVNIVLSTTTGTKIGTGSNQKIGFWNATPVARASAYTPTNVTADRSYDADATSIDELADVVGTLIADLQTYGLLA